MILYNMYHAMHGMPRFQITSAQDGDLVAKANASLKGWTYSSTSHSITS